MIGDVSSAGSVTGLVLGVLAVAAAWRLVSAGRLSIWSGMTTLLAALALGALLTGEVPLSRRVDPGLAAAAGSAAGLLLYGGTRMFVRVVSRRPGFVRQVTALYGKREGLALPVAVLLAGGIAAPAEEVFWRGFVFTALAQHVSAVAASVVAWLGYVAANAASGSFPVIAGATVGGAVWGGLAWWSGGALAGLLCHAVWTGLMVGVPPGPARARTAASAGRAAG